MIAAARKFRYFVERERQWRWLLLVGLALLVSAMEAAAAAFVYALLTFITAPTEGLAGSALAGFRARLFPTLGDQQFMLLAVASMAAFFVVRAVTVLVQTYLEHRITYNAGVRLSNRLLAGYLRMPYEFHLQRNSAELIRNTYETVWVVVSSVLVPFSRIVSESLIVVGLLTVLIVSAPLATGLAVAVLGPLVLVLLMVVHPWLKRLGSAAQRISAESIGSLQQALHGIRDIKLLGRESFFLRAFARTRAAHARIQYQRAVAKSIPQSTVGTVLYLVILAFLAVTLMGGGTAQEALAVLGLFAYAALRMLPSINKILACANALKFAGVAINQLYDDLVMTEAAGDSVGEKSAGRLPFERVVALDDVRFRYAGTEVDVLSDVSLSIRRGERIGIVGATGSGKSTLVDIIAGLLEPTSGAVRVDGADIRPRLSAWQRDIGVVSQSVFLIDDTLRRNIAFGVPDGGIDDARLREVIRVAQLDDLVRGLPDGLDAVVGERGVRLSGGQRQRVAIARALYRDPQVLIFDEATSALDNRTERELVRELQELDGGRTVILAAHRLTTVERCDRIVLLMDGRVLDVAPYEELVRRNPYFRDLTRTGERPFPPPSASMSGPATTVEAAR